MKYLHFLLIPFYCQSVSAVDYDPNPSVVEYQLKKTADWYLQRPLSVPLRHWEIAPLYLGLIMLSEVSGDPRYMSEVIRFGDSVAYYPGDDTYHADDHAVTYSWLRLYSYTRKDDRQLEPVKSRMDYILSNPVEEEIYFGMTNRPRSLTDRWTWCDALFMAPPSLAKLYSITGDERYIEFLDREYRYTYDRLWDPEEELFYRDDRFIKQKTAHGEKVFWARGNGWVYAGLALIIESLPVNHPSRQWYLDLYMDMTEALVSAQQSDGLWYPSLLDPKEIPVGEASASAFFCFGLAWGINQGILADTYKPLVLKAWKGLQTRVHPDGMVGYVQPVGAKPVDNITAQSSFAYGAGAYLMAGSEIIHMQRTNTVRMPNPVEVYQAANLLFQNDTTPQSYVRFEPRRVDDVAWENDRIAFRAYGPALDNGSVDSGIDLWFKRVPYPIVRKWYEKEFSDTGNYHKDTGEGMDAYSVGLSSGCGGSGLWIDDQLVKSGMYKKFELHWSNRKTARFKLYYEYPGDIVEEKTYTIHRGEDVCHVESRFLDKNSEAALNHLKIAVGLVSQDENTILTGSMTSRKLLALEQMPDDFLQVELALSNQTSLDRIVSHTVPDGRKELLLIAETNNQGIIYYNFGYTYITVKQ